MDHNRWGIAFLGNFLVVATNASTVEEISLVYGDLGSDPKGPLIKEKTADAKNLLFLCKEHAILLFSRSKY